MKLNHHFPTPSLKEEGILLPIQDAIKNRALELLIAWSVILGWGYAIYKGRGIQSVEAYKKLPDAELIDAYVAKVWPEQSQKFVQEVNTLIKEGAVQKETNGKKEEVTFEGILHYSIEHDTTVDHSNNLATRFAQAFPTQTYTDKRGFVQQYWSENNLALDNTLYALHQDIQYDQLWANQRAGKVPYSPGDPE